MAEKKAKRFRRKSGVLFRVPLGDDKYGYGQIVTGACDIFFDYVDDGNNTDVHIVLNSRVLFRISVQIGPLHDGVWEVLGVYPIREEHTEELDSFRYDLMKEKYYIIKEDMKEVVATVEHIRDLGLECMASWGYHLVEDRLRDHFAGRRNYWVDADLNQHNPDFPDIETFYRQQGYDYVWKGDSEE